MAAKVPTPLSTAQSWLPEQHIYARLYHGCLRKDAQAMRGGKIDPLLGQPDTDFGRGFYTTSLRRQAEDWAYTRYMEVSLVKRQTFDNQPVVIWFNVPRDQLAKLESLHFVRGDYDAEEYWSLVQHCRSSVRAKAGKPAVVKHHQRDNSPAESWYDMVAGHVAAFWQQRRAMLDTDQFSFHTARGVGILNQVLIHGTASVQYGIEAV